jgi:hypothetical protein
MMKRWKVIRIPKIETGQKLHNWIQLTRQQQVEVNSYRWVFHMKLVLQIGLKIVVLLRSCWQIPMDRRKQLQGKIVVLLRSCWQIPMDRRKRLQVVVEASNCRWVCSVRKMILAVKMPRNWMKIVVLHSY